MYFPQNQDPKKAFPTEMERQNTGDKIYHSKDQDSVLPIVSAQIL